MQYIIVNGGEKTAYVNEAALADGLLDLVLHNETVTFVMLGTEDPVRWALASAYPRGQEVTVIAVV